MSTTGVEYPSKKQVLILSCYHGPDIVITPYGFIRRNRKNDLSPDIYEALRMASTMFYFSKRCLLIVDYNLKRMQSNGDDLIPFGKYRGHYLHEILKVDPAYLSWIAYKYTPKIPKQERFVEIAKVYHSVHLDLMQRKARQKQEI